jgi:hypothetical protein
MLACNLAATLSGVVPFPALVATSEAKASTADASKRLLKPKSIDMLQIERPSVYVNKSRCTDHVTFPTPAVDSSAYGGELVVEVSAL